MLRGNVTASGEQHDFGKLLIQHQQRVYGYIRSLVANRADAEDVLQETASVLWQKFDEFQPGSNFLAWSMSVARYQVMSFYKRTKRDVLRFGDELVDAIEADTQAQSARLAALEDVLAKCLTRLRAQDRRLIAARYREETTPTSLAALLGRPVKTIYSALNRIRRQLTECVQRANAREERR